MKNTPMLKPVLAGFEKKISKIKIKIEKKKTSVGRLLTFDLIINPGIEKLPCGY